MHLDFIRLIRALNLTKRDLKSMSFRPIQPVPTPKVQRERPDLAAQDKLIFGKDRQIVARTARKNQTAPLFSPSPPRQAQVSSIR